MDTARARGQRQSTGAALARKLGAALAVIVVTSGAFAFVGTLGDAPDADPVAAGDPEPEESSDETASPDPDPEPSAENPSVAPDPEPTSEPEPDPEPSSEPEPDPEPTTEPEVEETASEPEVEETASEPETEEPRSEEPAATIPPGEITIQVLDGYKADGGAAMRNLAEDLRGQGYRVVAENQALDYQVTTVLWTQGNEAAARQVAATIGAGDVRPQPGNLSESVTVHIVVGADRG